MTDEQHAEVEYERKADGGITVETADVPLNSWLHESRHEGWLRGLVRDAVTDLWDAFRDVTPFDSLDPQTLAEDLLTNVDQVIETQGAEILNSPEWGKGDADEPQRWALAGIVGGALLSECRNRDLPVRVDEVARILKRQTGSEFETKSISRFKRRVDSAAGVWVSPTAVEQFLERYADELSIHPETLSKGQSITDDLPENTDPNVAATTALWLASRQTGEPMRRQTLLRTANVSGPAVRKATPDDEEYDYDKPSIRFKRTVGASLTLPEAIVEWLDLDEKYVLWPSPDAIQQSRNSDRVRTIPQAVVQLTIVDERPDTDQEYSQITEHEHKPGVWKFDVPLESHDYLPETVIPSWQWDWDQNTGHLILREEADEQ